MKETNKCPLCSKVGKGEIIKSSDEIKLWKCPYCDKNVEFIKQTEEDLKIELINQIQLLSNACKSFDEGYKIEAKNIASRIRTLLYDSRSSESVLIQLKKKHILFYNTALDYDSRNPFSYMGLIKIIRRPEGDEFFAPLDGDQSRYLNGKIDFDSWWNKLTVLEDSNKNRFTREDLILKVANKDGGSHVDPYLDKDYVNLTRKESIGWRYANNTGEGYIMGAELASLRQIAHEVLKSLKDAFPEIFDSNNLIIPIPKNKDKTQDEIIIEPPRIVITQLKDLENVKKIDFKDSEIEINTESLVSYLESSKTVDYWVNFIESLGIKVGHAGLVNRQIDMLKWTNIYKIGELDNLLKKSKEWGEKYLKGIYINITSEISSDRISLDRSHILTYFLIANFPDVFTDNILYKNFGYSNPENFTVPAEIYASPQVKKP